MKSPIEYIKEAWKIYTKKENFVFFAKIMAVLVIATTVVGLIYNYFYPTDYLKNSDFSNIPMFIGFITFSLTSLVLGLWTQTTTYFAIIKMGESEKEVFKIGYQKIGRFLLISLVIGLIILGGILLLIIPAIIFGVWYSFSTFLILDKGMKIGTALKTSKAMVKGKFWEISGRFFVFGLVSFVVSLLLTAIPYGGPLVVSFVAPLFMLPFYLLYKDLSVAQRD